MKATDQLAQDATSPSPATGADDGAPDDAVTITGPDDAVADGTPAVEANGAVAENIEEPAAASDGASAAEAEAGGTATESAPAQEVDDEEDLLPMIPKARWYIVHTYSGFEQRVEKTIREMRRTTQDMDRLIEDVVVPMEKVSERAKGGERRTTSNKIYPGYVMVRMIMTDLSWHLVQSIPKVTGFVGGKNRPTPMSDREAELILSQMKISEETPRPKFNFERSDEVSVTEGPFAGFNGIVEDVNYDKEKLRVSVSIFGRPTPVELDFSQVSKG